MPDRTALHEVDHRHRIHISLSVHPSLPLLKTHGPADRRTRGTRVQDLFDLAGPEADILASAAASPSKQRLDSETISAKPSRIIKDPESAARQIDPRFGPVRIDFVDVRMSLPEQLSSAGEEQGNASTAASSAVSQSQSALASLPLSRSQPSPAPAHTNPNYKARFVKTDSFPVEEDGQSGASGPREVTFGVVHLFKDAEARQQQDNPSVAWEDESGSLLAVLGLPSHMTAADFLAWVEPARDSVSKMRIIREGNTARCTVLMQFRDPADAEEFYKQYYDQPVPYFGTSTQPQSGSNQSPPAPIVYVTQVTVSVSSQLPYSYPQLANSDPWPLIARPEAGAEGEAVAGTKPAERLALSLASELPTCPVCLERMDSTVTGLMTVSCQHTFHCECLSRWGDSRCPVCRYSQNRARSGAASSLLGRRPNRESGPSTAGGPSTQNDEEQDEEEETSCTVCGTTDDLWVCLICATVGCGRYKKGCAKQHFVESGHLYSLELETSRVWDYIHDGYIHRLIQNRADGKLVELPSTSSQSTPSRRNRTPGSSRRARRSTELSSAQTSPSLSRRHRRAREGSTGEVIAEQGSSKDNENNNLGSDDYTDDDEDDEGNDDLDDAKAGKLRTSSDKLEAISMEYQYLLLSQLESQRAYYEERLRRLQSDIEDGRLESLKSDLEASKKRESDLLSDRRRFEQERSSWKDREARLLTRFEKSLEINSKLGQDLASERSLSKGILTRLEALTTASQSKDDEVKQLRIEVRDQQEQLRDLYFAMAAQDQLKHAGGGEGQGGDLVVRGGNSGNGNGNGSGAGGSGGEQGGSANAAKKKNKKKKTTVKKPPPGMFSTAGGGGGGVVDPSAAAAESGGTVAEAAVSEGAATAGKDDGEGGVEGVNDDQGGADEEAEAGGEGGP